MTRLDFLQMLYVVRAGKVRWQSRWAKRQALAEVPRLVEEIKWLRRTRPCSCDGDPIECNHEAARGQAEEERDQWRRAHDEFLAAWMETIPADERGDGTDPEATILAWAQMQAVELEHANAALAGSDEGLRLWRLDCHATVQRHRALTLQMKAERDALADRLAPTVWDASVPPGGRVCAAPVPDKPGGRCGMPVESEPCAEHDLEVRLQRAEAEVQRLRDEQKKREDFRAVISLPNGGWNSAEEYQCTRCGAIGTRGGNVIVSLAELDGLANRHECLPRVDGGEKPC
ncbi:hypothetical protein ACRYCC_26050 [Actinomadura scrupuli]|uniref:hypothetical protein n=1 Tax=Actinomadura scrupuli TaxID=559629 RepID=UPI003D9688B6